MVEEEIDPLDAFMASVSAELEMADRHLSSQKPEIVESDDHMADYVEKTPVDDAAGDAQINIDDVEEVAAAMSDKDIAVLPMVDHSSMKYVPFRREILKVHKDVVAMKPEQIKKARTSIGVQIHGIGYIAAPGLSFGHLGLSERLLEAASNSGFESPTPIQSQAVPVALSGRDVIGVASTGSGKTAAFLWPLILHMQAQSYTPMGTGQGPQALVLAPTRELSTQIYLEAKKYIKAANKRTLAHRKLKVAGVFGGMQMYQQSLELAAGTDLIVATPGRLLDHLRKGQARLDQVTFVVIDEADRLLQMGFEAQARAILGQIRPDRQTLLFSATFKKRVEALARSILKNPVRIVVGTIGASSKTVQQVVKVFSTSSTRINWLRQNLNDFLSRGQLIIFAGTRAGCELLARELHPVKCTVIHGDKTQAQRMDSLQQMKKNEIQVVVATDVAARGLDITNLATVVNFELARDVDSHVHRIGRVGRKGQDETGFAYTLLAQDMEKKISRSLPLILQNIEQAGQKAPQEAWDLAYQLAPDECSKLTTPREGKEPGAGPQFPKSNPYITSGIGAPSESVKMSQRFVSSSIPTSAQKLRQQFQSSFQKSSHTLGGFVPSSKPSSRWDSAEPIKPAISRESSRDAPSSKPPTRWDSAEPVQPVQSSGSALSGSLSIPSRWDSAMTAELMDDSALKKRFRFDASTEAVAPAKSPSSSQGETEQSKKKSRWDS